MAEYDIVLQLMAPENVSDDDLESSMLAVLEAVERHAADIALGPVVAADLDRRLIDLGFNVEAVSPGESQGKVGQVLQIIEAHTQVQFSATNAEASNSEAHQEAVCIA